MKLEFVVEGNGTRIKSALKLYATTFNTAHEPDGQRGFVTVRTWQRVGHPLLGKKTYADRRSKEGALFKDSSLFELTHMPDPETTS